MKIGKLDIYGIIYKIKNNKNGKVYIGQTTQPFNLRYSYKGEGVERVYNLHKKQKENGYYYNPQLLSAIEKYGFKTFEINEFFDVAFSREELDIKEKTWIQIYDSFRNGYNRNLGGDGNSGGEGLKGQDNPMSRKVVQLSLKGEFIKEWTCMAEAQDTLNIKGRITSACTGEKKSIGGYMWMYYEDYLVKKDDIKEYNCETGNYNKIPVIQLSLDGKFINRFNCLTNAAKTLNNIKAISKITDCCKRKRHSAYGYMWVYEDDYNDNNIPTYNVIHNGKPRKVVKLSLGGEFISEFDSISDAEKEFGDSIPSHISSVCSGKKKSHRGFIYMYKEDYIKFGGRSYKIKKDPKSIKVLLLDNDNNIKKKYNSINEAAKDLGVSAALVRKYINDKIKKPKYILIKEENYYKNTQNKD